MKEVLISGSRGFIGSQFSEFLKERQYKVVQADREGSCFTWPHIVLDFASYGNYHNQKDVAQVYEANLMRVLRLLQHTNHIEYKAFIVTGTSSEYGKADIPMHEALLPKPDSFYAAAKNASLVLGQTWARLND
jgi:UDP-glucose 4-epimerase